MLGYEGSNLSARMDPGVCPSGEPGSDPPAEETLYCSFKFSLDRAPARLELGTRKAGTVIFEEQRYPPQAGALDG